MVGLVFASDISFYFIETICSQILTVWGLIGIRSNVIGFKHVWEIWLVDMTIG